MLMVFSYLLSLLLTSICLSLYTGSFISIYSGLVLLVSTVTFAVANITQKKKYLGGVLVSLLALIGCVISLYGTDTGYKGAGMSFSQWVISAGDEAGDDSVYILTFAFAASMFFSFAVYYFTISLFRASFLTLVSLLPCVLYIKVCIDMNNFYLVLITLLNLFIYGFKNNYNFEKTLTREFKARKEKILALLFFSFAVIIITASVPKTEEAIFYDEFENLFLNGDTSSNLAKDYGNLSQMSGNADNYRNGTNRRLYNLYGTYVTYLKRQNFDFYDFSSDRWYSDTYETTDLESYEEINKNLVFSGLKKAFEEAAKIDQDYSQKYNIDERLQGETVEDMSESLNIKSTNYSAYYLLSSSRGISASLNEDIPIKVTDSGLYLLNEKHSENGEYTIYFYDTKSLNSWLDYGFTDMDFETEGELLEDTLEIIDNSGSGNSAYVKAFIDSHEKAMEYREKVKENTALISDEIAALSENITKGCTSDLQKARAIESYFENEGFVYDLDKVFEDTSPEYFLFTSKTGTCSDFASAFVLLARSAGLIVRYAEGYVPERTNSGYFYINEKDGHAYPEVYIENTGWVVFEPTVPSEGISAWNYIKKLKMDFGLLTMIFAFIVAAVILLFFFAFLMPVIRLLIWKIKIALAKGEKKEYLRYRMYQWIGSEKGIKNIDSLTPKELAAAYLEKTKKDINKTTERVLKDRWGKNS